MSEAQEPTNQPEQSGEPERDQPSKKQKVGGKHPWRWLRVLVWTAVFFSVTGMGFHLYIQYYTNEIISRVLREVVAIKSNGLYELEFQDLKFSVFSRELTFYNLSLNLDTLRYRELSEQGETFTVLYEGIIPELHLETSDFQKLYAEKSLEINNMYLVNPNVHIHLFQENKLSKKEEKRFNNLYFLISGYLKLFEVSGFELLHGDLILETERDDGNEKLNIHDLNISIEDFRIDSTSLMDDGKPFYVKDIAVNVGENTLHFEKQHFELSFEKFQLSIEDEDMHVQALRFKMDETESQPVLDLYFPTLDISGIQYDSAYFNKALRVRKLYTHKPIVSFHKTGNGVTGNGSPQRAIHKALSAFYPSVSVDTVQLDSAALDLYFEATRSSNLALDNFSLNALGFQFDSTNYRARERRFFLDDIDFLLNNYAFQLPDGLHTLKVRQVGLSTSKRNFYASNLYIAPQHENNPIRYLQEEGKDQLLDLYFSRIQLGGLQVWEMLLDKVLSSGKLKISSPRITIDRYDIDYWIAEYNRKDSLAAVDTALLVSIDSLAYSLEDAQQQQFDDLLEASARVLDSILVALDSSNQLLTDSLHLVDSTYFLAYQVDSLLLGEFPEMLQSLPARTDSVLDLSLPFKYSKNDYRSFFEPVSVFVLEPEFALDMLPDQIHLKTNQLSTLGALEPLPLNRDLIGLDNSFLIQELDSLWTGIQDSLSSSLTMDEPLLDRDSLLMASIHPLVENLFNRVAIQDIEVADTDFYINHYSKDTTEVAKAEKAELFITDFQIDSLAHLDSSQLFFSQSIRFYAPDLTLLLPDSIHQVQITELEVFTNDSLMAAKSIRIQPLEANRDSVKRIVREKTAVYDISLQDFGIRGFNLRDAFYDQYFLIGKLHFSRPNVMRFSSPLFRPAPEPPDSIPLQQEIILAKPKFAIHDFVSHFEISSMDVDRGIFSLVELTENATTNITGRDISLCARGLALDSTALVQDSILWDADDFELLVSDYMQRLPDSLHVLDIGYWGISLTSRSFFTYDVSVAPMPGMPTDSVSNIELTLPSMRFSDLDWMQVYRNREVFVNKLALNGPQFNAVLFGKPDSVKNEQFALEKLYSLFGGQIKKLDIERVELSRGRLDLESTHPEKGRNIVNTGFIDMNVRGFYLDSTSTLQADRFLYADDIFLRVKNYVQFLPDSFYSVRASELTYSTQLGDFEATYLHFAPNNWADPDFNARTPEQKPLFELYTPRLSIKGLGTLGLYQGDSLGLESFTLERPQFRLVTYSTPEDSQAVEKPLFEPDSVYSMVKPFFPDIHLESFRMDDVSVELTVHRKEETEFLAWENIFTEVEGFDVDSLSALADTRLFHADNVEASINDYSIDLPDSLYRFQAEKIGFSTAEEKFYVTKPLYEPRVDKYEIAEIVGVENDWLQFESERITFNGLDFGRFLRERALNVNRIELNKANVYVFRDKRPPFPKNNRPPMPQEALRKLPFHLKVDSLFVNRSVVSYEEHAEKSIEPGVISFKDLNAYAYNVTNDSQAIADNEAMQVYANSSIMGNGRLTAAFNFQLGSPTNAFTYQGELDRMELDVLNPMLENVAFVKINAGHATRLAFQVQADEQYADGIMKFYYKDLNVSLINPETKKPGFGRAMTSFIANLLLVKSDNPRFLFLKRGKIYQERDPKKSIFNYLAKTCLSGIKHSVGFSYDKPPKERRKHFFEFWREKRKGF